MSNKQKSLWCFFVSASLGIVAYPQLFGVDSPLKFTGLEMLCTLQGVIWCAALSQGDKP